MSVTAQNIITLADQKFRDPNSSTAIGEAKKLNALQEVLDDLNSDDVLPGSYRETAIEYCDTLEEYPAPSDFKAFLDGEPENRFHDIDVVTPEAFRRRSNRQDSEMIAYDWKNDTRFILLKTNSDSRHITVHTLSSPTGNGTWAANTVDSDATNVRQDNILSFKSNGAIAFDIDVSQSANNYAEISTTGLFGAVDLSDHNGLSSQLIDVYLPNATNITSILLRWGSASGVYWERTITTPANGGNWRSGKNQVRWDWEDATPTGSPSDTAIAYGLLRINYGASQGDMNGVRISFWRSSPIEIVPVGYASSSIAKDTATPANFLQSISSIEDVMLFSGKNDSFRQLVVFGVAAILFDNRGNATDALSKDTRYQELKAKWSRIYPSRIKDAERSGSFYV